MQTAHRRHRYHSPWKRAGYSFLVVAGIMIIGVAGFRAIEGVSYVDAFYLTSMIATAQGLSQTPATPLGKIFASLLAFVSLGAVVTAAGFLFGPFLGQLWKIGHERHEEGMNKANSKAGRN